MFPVKHRRLPSRTFHVKHRRRLSPGTSGLRLHVKHRRRPSPGASELRLHVKHRRRLTACPGATEPPPQVKHPLPPELPALRALRKLRPPRTRQALWALATWQVLQALQALRELAALPILARREMRALPNGDRDPSEEPPVDRWGPQSRPGWRPPRECGPPRSWASRDQNRRRRDRPVLAPSASPACRPSSVTPPLLRSTASPHHDDPRGSARSDLALKPQAPIFVVPELRTAAAFVRSSSHQAWRGSRTRGPCPADPLRRGRSRAPPSTR